MDTNLAQTMEYSVRYYFRVFHFNVLKSTNYSMSSFVNGYKFSTGYGVLSTVLGEHEF